MKSSFPCGYQWILVALAGMSLAITNSTASEKTQKKDPQLAAEEKEAQAEEDAEQTLDPDSIKRLFQGKFTVYKSEEAEMAPDVIGAFTADNHIYLVKASAPGVTQKLLLNDGKQTTLVGKVRNQGKYIIVQEVAESGAVPVDSRKRGGI